MKRGIFYKAGGAAILIAVLLGCQTTQPALIAPAESAIEAEQSGFSPGGGAGQTTIDISLLYGSSDAVKSWKVEISGNGTTQKTWTGDVTYLPASLSWDGKNDAGALAPEGTYTARLSIEYTKTYQPVNLESKSFVLDITPPTGSIALAPPQFTPSDQGVTEPMTLTINASSSLAKMDSWSLAIYDVAGGLIKSFSGQWPTIAATWDGSSLNGGFVAPAMTYKAVATVRDVYGNSAELKTDVPVAAIPLAAQQDLVQPQAAGFSPKSDTLARSIDMALVFGNPDALKTWKLSVSHSDKGVQRSWTGDATNLPQTITWDGTTSAGIFAPDGAYTAILSIDYGKSFKPVLVKSTSFVLDVAPPAGNVSANPSKLVADGKGGIQPVTFTLYGSSEIAGLKNWTLNVLDPGGRTVASFDGAWPPSPAIWDGSLSGGGKADPTTAYTYVAMIRDEYGNASQVRGSLATGELPAVQGELAITPQSEGFSPNGDQIDDTMTLALSYGQPSAVVSWKVDISYPGLGVQKSFSGEGINLPGTLEWDGKTDAGVIAPEGTYTATLSIDYGSTFTSASVTSAPFVLDVTPPTGTISLSSALFSPLEGSDTITLTLALSSQAAKIDSWIMDIYDPGGNLFRSFSGKWPVNQAVWDGKGTNGDMVQSAEDYPVQVKVRDQFGNTGIVKATVPVDILVEKTASGYRILASRIFFKAFTADYTNVSPELEQQNASRLDALAEKLKKFAGYKIRIVGHAVMINWDTPVAGKAEQEAILIPLSQARAEAVKKALVDRGLDAARFTTEGVGAADQLVPDSDFKDRWQNRRVALYLEKE